MDPSLVHHHYTLSPRRFLVLLAFSFFSFTQSYQWYTYAGFPEASQLFFGISPFWIQFYLAVGPVGFVIATPITIWFLDKKGLRVTLLLASFLCLLAGVMKAFALLLHGLNAWALVLAAQSLTCFAGVAAMAGPPKLSSVWFGPKERSISTSVAVVANSMGSSLGFLLGLACSTTDGSCVPLQTWIQLGVSIGQFLLILFFMFDAPPSASSHATDRDVAEISLLQSLKRLITSNGAFVFLALAAGCSQGVFSTWQALMVEILGGSSEGNWVGFAAQMCGVVGGLVLGAMAAVYRLRYKFFIVSLFFGSAAVFAVFDLSAEGIFLGPPNNFWVLAITASLGSFLCAAANPLFYELAVELAYPAPEGLVGAIVSVLVNIFGLPVYPLDTLSNGAQIVNWLNLGNALVFAILMLFMRETYQRARKDDEDQTGESAGETTKLIQ